MKKGVKSKTVDSKEAEGEKERKCGSFCQQHDLNGSSEHPIMEPKDEEGEGESEEDEFEHFIKVMTDEVYMVLDEFQRDLTFITQLNMEGFHDLWFIFDVPLTLFALV
jgi:hypothetical protein